LIVPRYNYRVNRDLLVARIDERLGVLSLSERKACLKAGINIHTIQNIRKGHIPAADKLVALARALEVPTTYLTGESNLGGLLAGAHDTRKLPLRIDYIVGEVRAGEWLEAAEWPQEERVPFAVPVATEYQGLSLFGVIVRGPSMNEIYPDGTVLIAIKLAELGREPEPGERVIVYRQRPDGRIEASAKEYRVGLGGRVELWPRSTSPEHKEPIFLEGKEAAGVRVHALVIGSYRPEKRNGRQALSP
jgi:repressor LexA